ncbi:AraC family transcriptional regulator [Paraburkholderia fungorum]|uniref:AraC family transcriptional regulator n=2 Tax=Paraburkholderia fungorum TaxID=134537 RepID=A0A420FCM1_9BURK|nr:AraC family transcriptional regulator [Paraburkholderia fungorum]
MVRHMLIDAVDDAAASIIAVGNDYPDGHVIPPHSHRRGLLLCGTSGTLVMTTSRGSWVMPPRHGMWIPPKIEHSVRAVGSVQMQSLYLEPGKTTAMPAEAQVVAIPPLLRLLIADALDLPVDYAPGTRASALMALIHHEVLRLEVLPLSLQYPEHRALAERCQRFLLKPRVCETTDQWSADLHMSRRAFTRLFRAETNLSFVAWRQQACLTHALTLLASGTSVTTVALELGYDSPAAFSTMFKKALGVSPRLYGV